VRSTTQRRGKTTKPRTVSERLTISMVHWADFVESGVELGAAVGAVGKDMPQPRMKISDRGQD